MVILSNLKIIYKNICYVLSKQIFEIFLININSANLIETIIYCTDLSLRTKKKKWYENKYN